MDEYLKEKLKTKTLIKTGKSGSGCISSGTSYSTDNGTIFVKFNNKPGADIMFEGEFKGLQAIQSTNTIKVPKPIDYGEFEQNNFIVMEYLDIQKLNKFMSQLGTNLAKMHLYNNRKDTGKVGVCNDYVDKYGFDVATCCGFIPQDNSWCDDWIQFFTSQKLDPQIRLILEKTSDRQLSSLWSVLQIKIPQFFVNLDIYPSLLHGDLWHGNTGETNTEGVIFDAAVFYGHHEFDLSISLMFGGISKNFYKSYHELIPRAVGFDKRLQLYKLFHYLNHWNHFGAFYRGSSLQIMKDLINM